MIGNEVETSASKDQVAVEIRRRFHSLDGMRGVAALLVVLLHVEWTNHLTQNNFVQHGYVAVDLFFILSGFVMASNYLRRLSNIREVRSFLGLRLFRLYPLHITMFLAFLFLECAKLVAQNTLSMAPGPQPPFTGGNSVETAFANIFLINGLHVLREDGWNGPSWSISCEIAAYIIFSATVLTGFAKSRTFTIWGTPVTVAAYVALAFARGTLNVTLDWGIIRCLAGFFIGVLLFQHKSLDNILRSGKYIGTWSIAIVVAIFATITLASGPFLVLVIPLFAIAIVLFQSDQGPVARVLASPLLQFLGRISYSVYMVHSFFVVCMLIVLKRVFVLPTTSYSMRAHPIIAIDPWIGDLLVLGLIIGVVATASATYAFVEEPGRIYGRRLLANRANRPSEAAGTDVVMSRSVP